ncbi:response regulator transcription factor [Cellulosimicrobium sp. CpK407]|uniref:helix-turn-helix transcriptional regulator n=1 Tax=Cellulosimicrobium sp. CpK407 TaxID=3229847 RepID=UPI003F3C221E
MTSFGTKSVILDAVHAGVGLPRQGRVAGRDRLGRARRRRRGGCTVPRAARTVMAQVSAAPGAAGRRVAAAKLTMLTENELDVARQVAEGLPNSEIAQTLFLGEATANTHLAAATAKLGLTNRVQLAALVTQSTTSSPQNSMTCGSRRDLS